MKTRNLLPVFCLLLLACDDPRGLFEGVIKDKHFIPFALPMPATRVGTILRGNANEMYLVATPEKCFPDFASPNSLRWVQATDLPQKYQHIEFAFDVGLNNLFNTGSETLHLKASAKYVKTVELDFAGATVEFLDEMNFYEYYASSMPATCKTALNRYPFIGQGLRVESMKFVFKDEAGAAIDLTGKLSEIVDIKAGVSWKIENKYSLIIETPKYIGYRMARINTANDILEIQYAASVDKKGSWLFKSVRAQEIHEN